MKTEILGINISDAVVGIIGANKNWTVTRVTSAEEAIEKFQLMDFDVVITPENDLDESDTIKLKKLLSLKDHDSMWISYNASNEDDLVKEIEDFLQEKQRAPKSTVSVIDNGIKRPDITIE